MSDKYLPLPVGAVSVRRQQTTAPWSLFVPEFPGKWLPGTSREPDRRSHHGVIALHVRQGFRWEGSSFHMTKSH